VKDERELAGALRNVLLQFGFYLHNRRSIRR